MTSTMNNSTFQGLIPDSLDLSAYIAPEQSYSIRPANAFTDGAIDILSGRTDIKGLPLPWSKAAGLFAFRPGEVTVWTGYKAHGKSMMLSQIMIHAMCHGERGLIISPEFRPEAVLARKIRQAACTGTPDETFARGFLRWAGDGRLFLFDHQGSLSPETVTSVIRYAIDRHQVTHVVVDSLMKCGIAPDDFARQKRFVDDLQSIAHQAGIHLHLVAHARKGENDDKPARLHDVKGTSELCDMAENVLSAWKNKRKLEAQSRGDHCRDSEADALLIVDSQRNGEGWTGAIQLWFHQQSFQFIADPRVSPRSYLETIKQAQRGEQ
jgi:twinkle protein